MRNANNAKGLTLSTYQYAQRSVAFPFDYSPIYESRLDLLEYGNPTFLSHFALLVAHQWYVAYIGGKCVGAAITVRMSEIHGGLRSP